MRRARATVPARAQARSGVLQRACGCGKHVPGGGTCSSCAASDARSASTRDRTSTVRCRRPVIRSTPEHGGTWRRPSAATSAACACTPTAAAQSAAAVDAHAYTVGRDVVFGAGRYEPATSAGRWLLAHELTHTVQQGEAAASAGAATLAAADGAAEREAQAAADSVAAGAPACRSHRARPASCSARRRRAHAPPTTSPASSPRPRRRRHGYRDRRAGDLKLRAARQVFGGRAGPALRRGLAGQHTRQLVRDAREDGDADRQQPGRRRCASQAAARRLYGVYRGADGRGCARLAGQRERPVPPQQRAHPDLGVAGAAPHGDGVLDAHPGLPEPGPAHRQRHLRRQWLQHRDLRTSTSRTSGWMP